MLQKLVWLGISLLLAVALARVAVWLQMAGLFTLVVYTLIVGVVLGTAIAFIATRAGETSRRLVAAGAVLAGAVCVAAEHGFFYLDYRRGFEAKLQSDPKAQLAATMNPEQFQPASFSKFMSTAAAENWPLWILDAVAMIGSAGAAAWFAYSIFASRSGDRG